jgi:7-carboxy-7-deazaguanine synthase
MKINELFYSIQGEGKWMGLPNIFIRTSGCNLRCSYCDTKYAYEEGKELEISELIKKISKYPCSNICITGGEPLLQADVLNFMDLLLKKGYKVCIETNGSIDIEKLPKSNNLLISLDIKCPSSKMDKNNVYANILKLRKKDQIKFVIKDKKDFDFAVKILRKYSPKCIIFFQPVWGTTQQKIANWILDAHIEDVRLGLQLHKIIWGQKRGK